MAGIGSVLLGMVFFVAQDGLMKSLLGTYPVWMLILVRAAITPLILVPIILWLGRPHRLITPLWPLHLARAVLFATGYAIFYAAFPFMGLAEVTSIFFSAPLFTALFASIFLGETVGRHRAAALIAGFTGVVIAMNPSGAAFTWVMVLPVFSAIAYSLSQILARQIGERETALTTGLYTVAMAGVFIVPCGWLFNQVVEVGAEFNHLRWAWPRFGLVDGARLALLGVVGMLGFMLLGRAYQIASASLVAPFDYAYLPMATLMAYLLWDEVPGTATVTGMGLIIASGLYLGYRELRVGAGGGDLPPVAEAAIAPGNPHPAMSAAPDTLDRDAAN
jgi:drug/metabolite transporter (DMT)-like permease